MFYSSCNIRQFGKLFIRNEKVRITLDLSSSSMRMLHMLKMLHMLHGLFAGPKSRWRSSTNHSTCQSGLSRGLISVFFLFCARQVDLSNESLAQPLCGSSSSYFSTFHLCHQQPHMHQALVRWVEVFSNTSFMDWNAKTLLRRGGFVFWANDEVASLQIFS